jgi:CRP-like cAMP-binding protein
LLDEASLSEIARWFDPHSISSGTELVGEGAAGYSFYVLADGRGAVSTRGVTVAELGPGDFFGEAAIVGDGRRHDASMKRTSWRSMITTGVPAAVASAKALLSVGTVARSISPCSSTKRTCEPIWPTAVVSCTALFAFLAQCPKARLWVGNRAAWTCGTALVLPLAAADGRGV